MYPQNINTPTYTLSATNASSAVSFTSLDTGIKDAKVIAYNSGTVPVFIVTGVTQPTAVFPTSATVPLAGKVLAPGSVCTFVREDKHAFLSGITSTGSASVYISIGNGE